MTPVAYDVSKFLHLQMLLTPEELEMFFASLGNFDLYDNSRVLPERATVSREAFFDHYRTYFSSLATPDKISLGGFAISDNPESICAVQVGDGRVMLKPKEPIIQFKEHAFVLGEEGKFLSRVHGNDVIRWGFELSFPQIYLDPETKHSHHVMREERFTNSKLFLKAMKWMRYQTRPVPFIVEGRLKRATFRIGLDCFDRVKDLHDMQKHALSVRRGSQ